MEREAVVELSCAINLLPVLAVSSAGSVRYFQTPLQKLSQVRFEIASGSGA